MRGTKSVRFLESQNKFKNENNQEPLRDNKISEYINQTIDNSQDLNKISVLEIEQYLKRAGSP